MALHQLFAPPFRHRKLFRRHFVHVLNFQLKQLLVGTRNNSNISRIVSWKTFWLLWTGWSGQVGLDRLGWAGCSGRMGWAGCSGQDIELVNTRIIELALWKTRVSLIEFALICVCIAFAFVLLCFDRVAKGDDLFVLLVDKWFHEVGRLVSILVCHCEEDK